jgi:hypothetical protein
MTPLRRIVMATSCPDCGAEVEYVSEAARLLTGTCGTCHHAFTIFNGHLDFERVARGAPEAPPDGAGTSGASISPSGVPCPDCGAPTVLRASSPRTIESRCTDCATTRTFFLSNGARPPGNDRPRSEWRGRKEDVRRPLSAGRPCRQCGAPLSFTTGEDGLLTGECAQCGNRFTLPARRESDGSRSDRRGRSSYGRGRPAGFAGGRGFSRGAGSRRPPPFNRGRSRDYPSDGEDAPRRRRSRRE